MWIARRPQPSPGLFIRRRLNGGRDRRLVGIPAIIAGQGEDKDNDNDDGNDAQDDSEQGAE